ncbi:uncharacterized protein BJ171DRAFT_537035 [Polychytrium aggregatum]|uniref:uncharacterized protein n=1 Tax=Polychytrium aggregatum TaxID=110093 RepID=UPI0022FE1B59|nr:uncharacterized protein BJ171DRAFT_537035 [Polychytrium aggregatum]KAI9192953.1 hypothetical protein BJ171DRAFT_537035 [Polychytrium aggregatum]
MTPVDWGFDQMLAADCRAVLCLEHQHRSGAALCWSPASSGIQYGNVGRATADGPCLQQAPRPEAHDLRVQSNKAYCEQPGQSAGGANELTLEAGAWWHRTASRGAGRESRGPHSAGPREAAVIRSAADSVVRTMLHALCCAGQECDFHGMPIRRTFVSPKSTSVSISRVCSMNSRQGPIVASSSL